MSRRSLAGSGSFDAGTGVPAGITAVSSRFSSDGRSSAVPERARPGRIPPSLIKRTSNMDATDGTTAHQSTARRLSSKRARSRSARIGPTTAPAVSIERWKPMMRPRSRGSVLRIRMASRGAERRPLPSRSTTRPTSTTGQVSAVAMMSEPVAAPAYPEKTISLRGRNLLSLSLISLMNAIVPSAAPSMIPMTAAGAPSTVLRKTGMSG